MLLPDTVTHLCIINHYLYTTFQCVIVRDILKVMLSHLFTVPCSCSRVWERLVNLNLNWK